ncbi:MAG: hypothetical protein JWM64_2556 [Frankiales bacterium]|nr:hypothetical protein [Frankiales bacterium]
MKETRTLEELWAVYREHLASPGRWPAAFPLLSDGRVEEGLVVWSQSGEIQGRTTGSRQRCKSTGCPGWLVGVSWETGQCLFPCSEGWSYDSVGQGVRISGGGEISARVICPKPWGIDPRPRQDWPDPASLQGKGFGVTPLTVV